MGVCLARDRACQHPPVLGARLQTSKGYDSGKRAVRRIGVEYQRSRGVIPIYEMIAKYQSIAPQGA